MTKWGGGAERDHWAYRTNSGPEMVPLGADQGQHLLGQQEGDPGPGDLGWTSHLTLQWPTWMVGAWIPRRMVVLRKGRGSPRPPPAPPHRQGGKLLVTQGYHQQTSLLQGLLYFMRVFAVLSFSLPIGGSQSPEILLDLPNLSIPHKNHRAGRRCKREERGDRKWSVTL